MNATIEKFGWPASLVHEFEHWLVLARPAQPTLGSLVLAAKSIGHKELEDKLMQGRQKLRRGIIFAASLYLVGTCRGGLTL